MSEPGVRKPAPPRLASALVRMRRGRNEAFLAADMAQEFDDLVASRGVAAARRWYWKQAFLSALPLIRRRLSVVIRSFAHVNSLGRIQMLQAAGNDVRYGWRMARRAPVVTASVMLAIALGIAASTAMFSVMEGVFLRPLPYPDSDQVDRINTVLVYGKAPSQFPRRVDWRAASTRLSGSACMTSSLNGAPRGRASLLRHDHVGHRISSRCSASVPRSAASSCPRNISTAVRPASCSATASGNRFGGDPSVVGRSIQLGTERQTIVGVLSPEADRFPRAARTYGMRSHFLLVLPEPAGSIALAAVGRLRRDATIPRRRRRSR
jgi:hypothetical protein